MPSTKKLLQAAAGSAGGGSLYVEDVFSTYLYEGNNAARTIANGIALSDEGGLVWLKNRGAVDSHILFDTVNGPQKSLASNDTAAGSNYSSYLSFPSAGTTGWNLAGAILNGTGTSWASWTFRKAKKFFDVQTYTGNGVAGRTVAHNLGAAPAVMLIKRTSASGDDWAVYHSGLGATKLIALNTTGASLTNPWLTDTAPTDSVFTLNNYGFINASGSDYVAYLFASDAGGFGDDGDENIIKCGSYTGNGSTDGPVVDVGFEPQWLLIKRTTSTENWPIYDNMRGMAVGGTDTILIANGNNSESSYAGQNDFDLTATGFRLVNNSGRVNASGNNYIYIAIRRPMKTPEAGTEVFAPISLGTTTEPGFVSGFVTDFTLHNTVDETGSTQISSRLTGNGYMLADSTGTGGSISAVQWDFMNGSRVGNGTANSDEIQWMFQRATGFMDVVAYKGNGVAGTAQAHNLGVVPEMMIAKNRSNSSGWAVYHTGSTYAAAVGLKLNASAAGASNTYDFGNASGGAQRPDASSVYLGGNVNSTNDNYILYLFATLAGVSKVGSYTGNATNTTIDCGFSNGARFILIKRTDSTGDWFVYDSLRGITTGVSPYLLLNTTAAEVTNAGWLESASSGFLVNDNASTQLNINNATYIFLAIA